MKRYPYMLEMLYEEDAILNADGSWTEGRNEWISVCRCNAEQNGSAREVAQSDGTVRVYSFEVTMPPTQRPIPTNRRVRIIDHNGYNIFDGKPKEQSPISYSVISNKIPKQRGEKAKLWL